MPAPSTAKNNLEHLSLTKNYAASPTGRRVHASRSPVRVVFGPIRSGKTVMCLMEILRMAMHEQPAVNNIRTSRWGIFRATYPMLKTTTVPTLMEWYGPLGKLKSGYPIYWNARIPCPDGTIADIELMFYSLETDADAAKIRSLDLTGAMISECAEFSQELVSTIFSRTGRYPTAEKGGVGFRSLICESNPPPKHSFWYKLAEEEKVEGFEVFRQPPALLYNPMTGEYLSNPTAENIQYTMGGYKYYFDLIPSSSQDFIRRMVLGEYGIVAAGLPVFPEFSRAKHVTSLEVAPNAPVFVGMDFGRTTAAVFTQIDHAGRLLVLDELVQEQTLLSEFIDKRLTPLVQSRYMGLPIVVVGDPTGVSRSSLAPTTAYQELINAGYNALPASTNNIVDRITAVRTKLKTPGGFLIDPRASLTIEALSGGYKYAKMTGELTDYRETPDKNPYSHPADALQYAALPRSASMMGAQAEAGVLRRSYRIGEGAYVL